jgi:hypothetical protein
MHRNEGNKKRLSDRQSAIFSSSLDLYAVGIGTLLSQVAGFHRAAPSTALDKGIKLSI